MTFEQDSELLQSLKRIADGVEGIQARLDKITAKKRHSWVEAEAPGFWRCTKCGVTTQDTIRADKKEPCI